MPRTPLAARSLPNYSRGEDWFNALSHLAGVPLGIWGLVLMLHITARQQNTVGFVTCAAYGASMILLYAMSGIYHALRPGMAKKIMQVLDHCAIYLLIAGTYTPIALCALRPLNPVLGWGLFGLEWGLALLSIVLNAIDFKQFAIFSMVSNLVMGWAVVGIYPLARAALGPAGMALMLWGGVAYTLGAVLYGIGHAKPRMHCVFHVFVLLGTILHLIAVLRYVI